MGSDPCSKRSRKAQQGAGGGGLRRLRSAVAAAVRGTFDPKVARYVQRRQWHPTQLFRRVDGGIELTMDVRGTTELVSWVLGFGGTAEIVDPTIFDGMLRPKVRRKLAATTPPSQL